MDNRCRLLPCQKERIIELKNEGETFRYLALKFHVSITLIRFICMPSEKEANLKKRQERGGSKQYYNTFKACKSTRNYRAKLKEIYKNTEQKMLF